MLAFVAKNWWIWGIVTFACFGLFYTNINIVKLVKEAPLDDVDRPVMDEIRHGLRVGKKYVEPKVKELPPSIITSLAFLGTRIFGALFITSIGLRFFGF